MYFILFYLWRGEGRYFEMTNHIFFNFTLLITRNARISVPSCSLGDCHCIFPGSFQMLRVSQ